MFETLYIIFFALSILSMLAFLIHNIYECVASHKFYKRMARQHDEFMKSLERIDK